MSDFVHSHVTARKAHRCGLCRWSIRPGEEYWRSVVFDAGDVSTWRVCEHCERVVHAYCQSLGQDEWDAECVIEFLSDEHPNVWAQMRAGWSFPDGERVPAPFGSTCVTCGVRVEFRHLWCSPCDDARIARLDAQFRALAHDFEEAKR